MRSLIPIWALSIVLLVNVSYAASSKLGPSTPEVAAKVAAIKAFGTNDAAVAAFNSAFNDLDSLDFDSQQLVRQSLQEAVQASLDRKDAPISAESDWNKTLHDPRVWALLKPEQQEAAGARFTGDDPTQAHHLFWQDKAKFIASLPQGRLPEATEFADVVVVGGGMGGLSTAQEILRIHPTTKLTLLEQAAVVGGHARGETWDGVPAEIGASYIGIPQPGTDLAAKLDELGLSSKLQAHTEHDPMLIDGTWYEDVWKNGTVPESKDQFEQLARYFDEMSRNENGKIYPEIPYSSDDQRKYVAGLDGITLQKHLEDDVLKQKLHPHALMALEHYMWSSALQSISEISAANGLSFFVGDWRGKASFANGNAAISEAMHADISKRDGAKVRTSSIAFNVKVGADGVDVSYQAADGSVKTVRARWVVMAVPLFVAEKIVEELEPERVNVIAELKYRAYMVASALIHQLIPKRFYDLYFSAPRLSKRPGSPRNESMEQGATDVILHSSEKGDKSVLTLFQPLPYEGSQGQLYRTMQDLGKAKESALTQLKRDVLPGLGVSPDSVKGVRIALWGHSMPIPPLGFYAKGLADILRKPFKEKVVFVHQDVWQQPSFETIFSEALLRAREIAADLRPAPTAPAQLRAMRMVDNFDPVLGPVMHRMSDAKLCLEGKGIRFLCEGNDKKDLAVFKENSKKAEAIMLSRYPDEPKNARLRELLSHLFQSINDQLDRIDQALDAKDDAEKAAALRRISVLMAEAHGAFS